MRPASHFRHSSHRNPIVCGRKFCARCGRWRHACDFRPMRSDPHQAGMRLFSYCRCCERVRSRQAQANWTAKQRELRREYDRIYKEARRRQAGVPSRGAWHRSLRRHGDGGRLEPGPLLAALWRWHAGSTERSWDALVRASGVPQRTLHRLLHGESRHASLDVADRLAVAVGVPLAILYPDNS